MSSRNRTNENKKEHQRDHDALLPPYYSLCVVLGFALPASGTASIKHGSSRSSQPHTTTGGATVGIYRALRAVKTCLVLVSKI
jgi:hypothetical protein